MKKSHFSGTLENDSFFAIWSTLQSVEETDVRVYVTGPEEIAVGHFLISFWFAKSLDTLQHKNYACNMNDETQFAEQFCLSRNKQTKCCVFHEGGCFYEHCLPSSPWKSWSQYYTSVWLGRKSPESLSPLRKLTLVKIGSALSHSSRVSFNRSLTSSSPSLGGAQLMKTAAAAAAATKFTTTSFRGVSMKTRH